MIKFLASQDGKPMYGFGLTQGNMDKLLAGQPILIDLDVIAAQMPRADGEPRGSVFIFGGPDEQFLVDELRRHGVNLQGVPVHKFDESKTHTG